MTWLWAADAPPAKAPVATVMKLFAGVPFVASEALTRRSTVVLAAALALPLLVIVQFTVAVAPGATVAELTVTMLGTKSGLGVAVIMIGLLATAVAPRLSVTVNVTL